MRVIGGLSSWMFRDLEGHLDSTFHGWSSTLASRVRLVIFRLVLVFALPLDFHGRLRVLRSMFIPGALHGVEASFLAGASMRRLRAAILGVVWSRRQPLACVGAVLSLLDGPSGCLAYCVVWFRFRKLRWYLAYRPGEVSRVYRLLCSAAVVLVMALLICLFIVRLRLVFVGILRNLLGIGLVCLS